MGHSGSVQRPSRRNVNGALYGEPVGSAAAANAANGQPQYTQAQLQALYLSRGRPDMAFMTNQAATRDMPEMQQTSTIKNHVNLKKSSLKVVPRSDEEPDRVSLQFEFDATKPCRVKIYLVAVESIDDETGCSSYALAHPDQEVITSEFPQGLNQKFQLSEQVGTSETPSCHEPFFDLARFEPSELFYDAAATAPVSLRFPIVIVLDVRDNPKHPQSQATFVTLTKRPGSSHSWGVKVIKQKIQVSDVTYELQEIYGIDGSVSAAASAAKGDGNRTGTDADGHHTDDTARTGTAGAKGIDEVDVPDGAECIICMCEPRNTTILPCRHMCLCGECAEALRKSSHTCPICRTPVEALLQISVGNKDTDDDDDS